MKSEAYEILVKYYRKLLNSVLSKEKKLKNKSVLLTLIVTTSNKVSKYLNDSSIRANVFPIDNLKWLEEKRFIRISDDKDKLNEYILTAHGIFEVEKQTYNLSINTHLDFIQDKYLTFTSARSPLKEVEKIILLSMIGARVFSKDITMNLKSEIVQDNWLEIFKCTIEFLDKFQLLKKKELSFKRQGNEHPVSYAMRRANELKKKTQHIYGDTGNKEYFLDIVHNKEISEPKLKRLFLLVFKKIENLEMTNEIYEFCNKIAYEHSKYVRDDFDFIESKYDEKIKSVLKDIYLDR